MFLYMWSLRGPRWAELEEKVRDVFPNAKFDYYKKVVKRYRAYKCDRDESCSMEEAYRVTVDTRAIRQYGDDFSIEGDHACLYVSCPVESALRGEAKKLIDLLASLGYKHRSVPMWLLLYGVAFAALFGGIGLLKLLGV